MLRSQLVRITYNYTQISHCIPCKFLLYVRNAKKKKKKEKKKKKKKEIVKKILSLQHNKMANATKLQKKKPLRRRLCIYKFTSKCHSQSTTSSKRR